MFQWMSSLSSTAPRWVPAGEAVTVGGVRIAGGMIYVGAGMESVVGRSDEPAMVNPNLKVNLGAPDRKGATMTYYPSYSSITPEARGAYLEWLSHGRSYPDAYIGYVFLFFYGLERRLLHDLSQRASNSDEIDLILVEVDRLLLIYGERNRSFQGYATRLREMAALLFDRPLVLPDESVEPYPGEYPIALKVGLGKLVIEGKPIAPRMAFSWVEHHPDTRLGTVVQRCRKEFRILFALRYREVFGDGMVVQPNKTLLKIQYYPASASLPRPMMVKTRLPDLTTLSVPIKRLRELVESCVEDLSAYSRAMGRGEGMLALAYLPGKLLPGRKKDFAPLQQCFDSALGQSRQCKMPAREILRFIGKESPRKPELGALWTLASNIGFGIEPDPRFLGPAVRADERVVVFRHLSSELRAFSVSREYEAAALLLNFAVVISLADGTMCDSEQSLIDEYLKTALNLPEGECRRLHAYLAWLADHPPKLSSIAKKAILLPESRRRDLVRFLASIVNADGVISPGEIKTLGKIYKSLGLNPDEVYSDLHLVATTKAATEPVWVKVGDPPVGFPIPPPPSHAIPGLTLDTAAIARKLAETHEVHALLSDIFSSEEDEHPTTTQQFQAEVQTIPGLDVEHSLLLRRLMEASHWAMEEFDALCTEFGLMASGAIETLNEAAYNSLGAPLLEGDDPLEFDLALAQEMVK